jgi:cytochrome c oxidase subunit 2
MVEMENYQINWPPQGIQVKQNELVEFVASSKDVTYGLGVFRSSDPIVFQMQVVPGYQNAILWRFDEPGTYNVRSTEYSGPRHPQMFVRDAIRVLPQGG